jgi:hypothetical protein
MMRRLLLLALPGKRQAGSALWRAAVGLRCRLVGFSGGHGLLFAPDARLEDDHVIKPPQQQRSADDFRSPQHGVKAPPQD